MNRVPEEAMNLIQDMVVEEKKAASGEQGVDILVLQGENRWLSNFWQAQVILDWVVFPSIEHAYQAAKLTSARTE